MIQTFRSIGSHHADSLQHINLKIFDKTNCQNTWGQYGELSPDRQLCVGGDEGRDSCSGDSGSALMTTQSKTENNVKLRKTWKIVGIVSFGTSRCGTHQVPGVYTKVRHYIDWILDTIKL